MTSRPTPWRPRNRLPPIKIHGQDPFKAGDGPSFGGAKVSDDYVRAIRKAHAAGMCMGDLVAEFHLLKHDAIRSIIKRQSWKHVR